jgi:hypothetical protein
VITTLRNKTNSQVVVGIKGVGATAEGMIMIGAAVKREKGEGGAVVGVQVGVVVRVGAEAGVEVLLGDTTNNGVEEMTLPHQVCFYYASNY